MTGKNQKTQKTNKNPTPPKAPGLVLAGHSDREAGEPAPGSVPSLESFCAARARARSEQGGGRAPAAEAEIPEVSRTPAIVWACLGPVGPGARDGNLAGPRGWAACSPLPFPPGPRGRGCGLAARERAPAAVGVGASAGAGRGGRGAAGASSRTGRPPPRPRPFPPLPSPERITRPPLTLIAGRAPNLSFT